ncbi:hypothetical protein ACRRTK_012967 [Alexandromys fortis]
MVNLGKDEDTCEDREHWGGWRILRQMKSLGKAGARHCEISICTCFSLDSELVPEMENAKADTSASEIQGFCDPGQGRGELYSPEIRHSIAALLEFMWAGKEFTFTAMFIKNSKTTSNEQLSKHRDYDEAGQHHGHPIDDLQSLYLKEKDTPQKLFKQLTDTHWTDITRLTEKLEEQKCHSEKMIQGDKEFVLQYFKELSDALEQKKKLFLAALRDVGQLINREYTPQIEKAKEIREQQLELIAVTTSLQDEAPLKFLEKIDDVRQSVHMLKRRPLPEVQPVEMCPQGRRVLKEERSRTEIRHIKKAATPEMRISSKRMPSSWPDKHKKELEFFNILNIAVVSLTSVILMLILFFNQHIITFLNEITLKCFSEVSLSAYQSLSNNLNDLKNMACYILYLLKEIMWKNSFSLKTRMNSFKWASPV